MTQDENIPSTAKKYRIVEGSFRDADGSIKGVGDTLELADHDALSHGLAVALVEDKPEPAVAETLAPTRAAPLSEGKVFQSSETEKSA